MKVSKMTRSKKVPDRWYLELEDGETLKVGVNQIADFSLFTGRDLSDEELEALRESASEAAARARALRLVGTRQMSRGEVKEKLIQKGESEETAESAADFLERIGAVNDEEYAAGIVRHYTAKGYGIGRVKNELMRRKVPRELWDEALSGMPDVTENIDRLVNMKLRGKDPTREELKKTADMLYRRGFSWEEIKGALRRFENAEDME